MTQLYANSTRWIGLCLAYCALATLTFGQPAFQDTSPAPRREAGPSRPPASLPAHLQFRQVFVPAEYPDRWPTQGNRYLPIDRSEFEQLLTDVHGQASGRSGANSARVAEARHVARWQADETLAGRTELDIVLDSEQPALLSVAPWSPAITDAHWARKSNADPPRGFPPFGTASSRLGTERAASKEIIPIALGNRDDGTLAVLVNQSGRLVIDWKLHGQRGMSDTPTFDLRVPHTATTQWLLHLPPQYLVTAENARAVELSASPDRIETVSWQLQTGGRALGPLRLLERGAERQRRELNLLRQTDVCRISPRGIDLVTRLSMDVHGEPLAELLLDIDSRLEVVSAQLGGQSLHWTWAPSENPSLRRMRVELPEHLSGGSHTIEIAALAPVAMEQSQSLPRIVCKNALWQEGAMELTVEAPLELRQLITDQARQTPLPDDPNRQADFINIQYFSERAKLEYEVGYPPSQLEIQSAEHLQFTPSEVTVRASYDAQSLQGEQALLVAKVGSHWQIDAVESNDPRLVGDWDVEGVDADRRLTVRLAQAVRPDRPVRITVLGRRGYGMNEPLSVNDLAILDFSAAGTTTRRMWLEEPDGLDWQILGKEGVRPIDLAQLAPEDPLRQIDATANGWGFVVNNQSQAIQVVMTPRRPRFSTHMRNETVLHPSTLSQTMRIECQPSGTAMDRLLVHLSQPFDDEQLTWHGDQELGTISARGLSAEEQLAMGAGNVGRAWELTWRTPSRAPFEIQVKVETPANGLTPLTLVATPEAVEQRGVVSIRMAEDTWLTVENRRLQPLPSPSLAANEVPDSAGDFRYDPLRDGLMDTPAILIKPQQLNELARGAWVWQALLDSRFSSDTEATHMAVFQVQTAGQAEITLSLPPEAELLMMWINDVRQVGQHRNPRKWTLILPTDRALATISVFFRTRASLPRLVATYEPTFPQVSVPVMAHRWRLWVPQNYSIYTESPTAHPYSIAILTWSQRLLGPLGRSQFTGSRNPFSAEFWRWGGSGGNNRRRSQEMGERMVTRLGQLILDSDPACATWGGLLNALAKAEPDAKILLAQALLADVGLSPQSPVIAEVHGDAAQTGAELLRSANLLLFVHNRRVLVAPTLLSALAETDVQVSHDSAVAVVTGGKLAEDMVASHVSQQDDSSKADSEDHANRAAPTMATAVRFIDLGTWDRLVTWENPWVLPKVVAASLSENNGWRLAEFRSIDPETISQASVINRLRMNLSVLLLASIIAALGITLRWAASTAWLGLVAVAATLALLAPLGWNLLAAGLFTSAVFAAFWFVVRRTSVSTVRLKEGPNLSSPTVGSKVATAVTLGSWVFALFVATQTVVAEVIAQAAANLPTVLVPVDSNRRPTSDKVHMPESLYQDLLEASAQARSIPRGWLMTQAHYQVDLSTASAAIGSTHFSMNVAWQVHVFAGTSSLTIPLFGDGVEIDPDSIRLDGRPASAQVDSAGLVVPVRSSGPQRLELALRLPRQFFGTLSGFEINVPPVANAQLELINGDQPIVEIPGARGEVRRDASGGTMLQADLGAISRLMVRYRGNADTKGIAPNFEVDELFWAKVRPGAMVIDVRLPVRVLTGKLRELRLMTDRNLQLVAATATSGKVTATPLMLDESQQINLEFAEPIADRTAIELRFVVADTSGIGKLRIPQLKLIDIIPTRRFWAISLDAALSFQDEAHEQLRPLAIPDFTSAWGESERLPDLAFREGAGESPLTIATRPTTVQLSTTEKMDATARLGELGFVWSSQIDSAEASVFQWRVRVPRDIRIDGINLSSKSTGILPMTWSRDLDDDVITLRSTTPMVENHVLAVQGRVPVEPDGRCMVPAISLEDSVVANRQIAIRREFDVRVSIASADGWEEIAAPTPDDATTTTTRLVAAFAGKSLAKWQGIGLEIVPNSPTVRAELATIINCDDNVWTADLEMELDVSQGMLDRVVLRASRDWRRVDWRDPAMASLATIRGETVAGSSDQLITLQLRQPTTGALRCSLRGELAAQDPFELPEIRLDGAVAVEQFVILPKHRDLVALTWQTTGLEHQDWKIRRDLATALSETHDLYRVDEYPAQARPLVVEKSTARQRIDLAEHWVAWLGGDSLVGMANFYLAPAEIRTIEIALSPEMAPLHCRCGSTPIELRRNSSGLWDCELPTGNFPQVITLFYRRTSPGRQRPGQMPISLPTINQAELTRSLAWGVGAFSLELDAWGDLANPIDGKRYQQLRSAAIVNWASANVHKATETRGNNQPIDREGAGEETSSGTKSRVTSAKDESQKNPTWPNDVTPSKLAEPTWTLTSLSSPLLMRTVGESESLPLRPLYLHGSSRWLRWVFAAVICLLAAMVLIHRGPSAAVGTVSRWGFLMGTSLALLWWSAIPQAGITLLFIAAVASGWSIHRAHRRSFVTS